MCLATFSSVLSSLFSFPYQHLLRPSIAHSSCEMRSIFFFLNVVLTSTSFVAAIISANWTQYFFLKTFFFGSTWYVVATLLRNGVNLQNLIVSADGMPSPAKFMVCLCVSFKNKIN